MGIFIALLKVIMIKHVFLDLDDTIFDFKKAEAVAVTRALSEADIEPTPQIVERYSAINEALWKQFELGTVTRAQILVDRFKILFDELGVERDAEQMKMLYCGYLSEGHYFIDGAEDLLEALYPHYKLYLASNGTTFVQEGRLRSSGIARYFEEIFISQNIGHNKPSVEFFDYCFSKIENFNKAEAIIIGDSLSSDISGGISAGIHTCWYNPQGKTASQDVMPEYTVAVLDEIPKLLKEI